ncbi:TAR DNA-binding protein 43 [Schistosoma japonicum]|nr:TAR DNA-binding protein 43 [Schistosoma japonicum]
MQLSKYVKICETEDDQPIEVPLEDDDTLLLSTLTAQFPDCTGLKYKSGDSGCFRGVRLLDDRLFPPADGHWYKNTFCCVFPKCSKRKADEDSWDSKMKQKRFDKKTCTDLIVLNLPWRADEDTLRDYFSQYGDLVMIQIKRDPVTQQSKGYGFIRFADYAAQVMCLAERHTIENRQCDVRIPISKMEGDRQDVARKVHVGGLTEDISPETLRQHFSQYGRVSDVFIPKPFRSFAFITFDDPEVAASLLGKDQEIQGVRISIGSAVPKLPHTARQNINNNQRVPITSMQAALQSTMMGNQPWGAWSPAYGGMIHNNRYRGDQYSSSKGGNRNGSIGGMNPAAAAAAAVLAAEYTRVHHNRNTSTPVNGQSEYNGVSVDSSNSAALATMNILSNPNVVAAIVSAATGAGNASVLGNSGVSLFADHSNTLPSQQPRYTLANIGLCDSHAINASFLAMFYKFDQLIMSS